MSILKDFRLNGETIMEKPKRVPKSKTEDVWIPPNADAIIDVALERARQLLNECDIRRDEDSIVALDSGNLEDFTSKLEMFMDHLNIFPYRWSDIDPLRNLVVLPDEIVADTYTYSFYRSQGGCLTGVEELVEVPYQLFSLLKLTTSPKERPLKSSLEWVAFGQSLCRDTVRYLTSLKQVLSIRTKHEVRKTHTTQGQSRNSVNIPANALEILDDVLKHHKDLREQSYRNIDPITRDEYTINGVRKAYEEFDEAVGILPTRWCKLDPFTSDTAVQKKGLETFVSNYTIDESGNDQLDYFPVPEQLYEALNIYYTCHDQETQHEQWPEDVCYWLEDLRRKCHAAIEIKNSSKEIGSKKGVAQAESPVLEHADLTAPSEPLTAKVDSELDKDEAAANSKQRILIVGEPIRSVTRMPIPEGATSIVQSLVAATDELERQCSLIGPDSTQSEIEVRQSRIEECIERIEMLPYQWAQFDPFDRVAALEDRGIEKCFHFFDPRNPPFLGLARDEFVPIPDELYFLWDGLPESRDINLGDPLECSAFGNRLAVHVRNHLMPLIRKLKTRDKMLGRSQVSRAVNEQVTSAESSPELGERINGAISSSSFETEEGEGNIATDKRKETEPELRNSGRILVCAKGEFTFTKDQAPVVKVLFNQYISGNDFMAEEEIFIAAKRETTSFNSLFKSIKKKPVWQLFERHQHQSDLWRFNLK